MSRQSVRLVLASGLLLGFGCGTASVAVHPINNKIAYSHAEALKVCDQAAQDCTKATLTFKPVDATFVEGKLVFVTAKTLYRCSDTGTGCTAQSLTFSDARSVSAGSSSQVVVVSAKGKINLCGDSCSEPVSQ